MGRGAADSYNIVSATPLGGLSDLRAPRFSVIVPTHNRADAIQFALKSALWQTVEKNDCEILVAGDGCTDETANVVASFDDVRIRWFDLPKAPGVGYTNRNAVLREARGEYIAYLGHDDIWFPDHLERLGALLDETGGEFAHSRGLTVDLDGRIVPYWFDLRIPGHQAGLRRGDSLVALSTVVHTRACLSKYGYWDEALLRGADKVMWHRILTGGEFRNVQFLSTPTSIRFVSRARHMAGYRALTGLRRFALGGFLDEVLPKALHLQAKSGEFPQQTAWRYLAEEPEQTVAELRRATVQLQDVILGKARTSAGLMGLRVGLGLGAGLDRLWRTLQWISRGDVRRRSRAIRRARPLERRRAAGELK